ncbi:MULTISPECIES: hypothetical protein [unclassified Amycolatopsis]|nr:hypothetical protein [Amycolatopsis sp. FBCC-B4732]
MWIAVSTPVALLIATVLMERFERRCRLVPTAETEQPRVAR